MKKVTATRNGETEQFTELAWRKMPKNKYGWKQVTKVAKEPEPLQDEQVAKEPAKKPAKKRTKTK